jgi:O-antigen/teichoic acid export membrane protein
LAGGAVASQALALVLTPVLTRLYGPAEFGLLAVFVSVVSIGVVPASLRYEQAIPVPVDPKEAAQLLLVATALLVGSSTLLSILIGAYGEAIAVRFGAEGLVPFLWLLVPTFFCAGLYQVLNLWAVRAKAFSKIAKTRVSKNAGMLITQVGLGFAGFGSLGLVLGEVVNRVMGMGVLGALAWKHLKQALKSFQWREMISVAQHHWKFPALAAPSALLNAAGFHLPVILLAYWFGEAVVGWFALSLRVLQLPVAMVGQAVAQVFFSEAGENHREGGLGTRVEEVAEMLLRLGVGPALFIVATGGHAFAWVFGPEWVEAGRFSQWLMPWLLLTFVTSPLSTVVFVLDKQRGELLFQGALLVGRISALGVGFVAGSSMLAIVLFSVTSAAIWLGYLIWLLSTARASRGPLVRRLGAEAAYSIVVLAPFGAALTAGTGAVLLIAAASVGLVAVLARSVLHLRSAFQLKG